MGRGTALPCFGSALAGQNGMPCGISRLIAGVSAEFYRAKVDRIFDEFDQFDEPDVWETYRTWAGPG